MADSRNSAAFAAVAGAVGAVVGVAVLEYARKSKAEATIHEKLDAITRRIAEQTQAGSPMNASASSTSDAAAGDLQKISGAVLEMAQECKKLVALVEQRSVSMDFLPAAQKGELKALRTNSVFNANLPNVDAEGEDRIPPSVAAHTDQQNKIMVTEENRSQVAIQGAKKKQAVVLAGSPSFEGLAKTLSKRLGCEHYGKDQGPTIDVDTFKSGDPNIKFNWDRIVGRRVIFIFDTVDQSRLFSQLCLLQAIQGFAVPDSDDRSTSWKTYADQGKYSWGRISELCIIIPWYRPCQMERTSRWAFSAEGDKKWDNSSAQGMWLDVPTAQYMCRLLCTPGSVPPLPGPVDAVDGMPLKPSLWRPPLEILFIELHEEKPIEHCASDLGSNIKTVRFVPYFLQQLLADKEYPGKNNMYVLFPDRGAFKRYYNSVLDKLSLDYDHILYIKKTRVGESIEQVQKLFYEQPDGPDNVKYGEKTAFTKKDTVLIIDDFTNSGSTLLGAVSLVQKMAPDGNPAVSIFVSHLVASYDTKVVETLLEKVRKLGDRCRLFTTNSIPLTTNVLEAAKDPQVKVYDLAPFIEALFV